MPKRSCIICGVSIEHRRGNAITCSSSCALERMRDSQRAYAQTHKNDFRERAKRYRENHPDRVKAASQEYRLKNLRKVNEYNRLKQAELRAVHTALKELNLI